MRCLLKERPIIGGRETAMNCAEYVYRDFLVRRNCRNCRHCNVEFIRK